MIHVSKIISSSASLITEKYLTTIMMWTALFVMGCTSFCLQSHAQQTDNHLTYSHDHSGNGVDILPPTLTGDASVNIMETSQTHAAIKLTPDKSELVRLEVDAGTIIVGNPIHANVVTDSQRTLVVIPRAPGATHFTVLDKKGQIIMQRHIIVASPKKDYVRVKRVCREDSDNCQNTSVFYCPDMCHEIGLGVADLPSGQQNTTTPPTDSAANIDGSSYAAPVTQPPSDPLQDTE